jgi:3-methyladenine DNA glycosylase/8-oxoguanine DNA glycosylase
MFDLNANPQAIHQTLARDPLLKRRVDQLPGLRLPGSWDPFETAIRAVVGQQISVKGAVTQLGRIASLAGPAFKSAQAPRLKVFFPEAVELAAADLADVGMPRKRKTTIRELSRQVACGSLTLDGGVGLTGVIDALTTIAGIGPWTANYVAMRALNEPDAFPASDLGIVKALQEGTHRPTISQVKARAEAWRPWRAYATVYLWQTLER